MLTYSVQCNAKHPKIIEYTAIEPFPIDSDLVQQLNYVQLIKAKNNKEFFQQIHASSFKQQQIIAPGFLFTKIFSTVQEYFKKMNPLI